MLQFEDYETKRYEKLGSAKNGMIPFRDDKYHSGFLNIHGDIAIKPIYSETHEFSNGLALVKDNKRGYGFINHTGKEVIPCQYSAAFSFSESLAPVQDKETKLWGFIDVNGNFAFPYQYKTVNPEGFIDGKALVLKIDNTWKYINTRGDTILTLPNGGNLFTITPYNFHNNIAKIRLNCIFYDEGYTTLYSYINTEGETVVPFGKYKEASDFSEGLARVINYEDDIIYINNKGEEFLKIGYADAESFHNGLAQVYDVDKGWGYINRIGEEVIPCQYPFACDFKEKVALVNYNTDSCIYITKTGEPLFDDKLFASASDFSGGYAEVEDFDGNHYVIDKNGNVAFERKVYNSVLKLNDKIVHVSANSIPELSDKKLRVLEIAKQELLEDVKNFETSTLSDMYEMTKSI